LAYNWFVSHHQDIGYQKAKSEYAEKLQQAKDDAIAIERDLNHRYQEAQNARIESEKLLDVHRRNARAADERLRIARDDFSKRLSAASASACRHAAETAVQLLGECSSAYRDVAESSDGHLADFEQCRIAWPVVP
jgi:sugar-specific transcriptional regulator TrmB